MRSTEGTDAFVPVGSDRSVSSGGGYGFDSVGRTVGEGLEGYGREAHWSALHDGLLAKIEALEQTPESAGDDALFLNVGSSNYHAVFNHLRLSAAGSSFTSGGGSLGWNGGAALRVKLARPEKTVISLTGDGAYRMSRSIRRRIMRGLRQRQAGRWRKR